MNQHPRPVNRAGMSFVFFAERRGRRSLRGARGGGKPPRYGLDDGRPKTLEEVGREFDVTRERIRQIEAKALRKLRHPTRAKEIESFKQ